jgi:hypothetical protein
MSTDHEGNALHVHEDFKAPVDEPESWKESQAGG